jgi:hypothetical protein
MNEKTCAFNNERQKNCMQVSFFFYSADLRTRFARKKKYYFTHLLHK